MAMTIHHNTAKRAKRLGLLITVAEGAFEVYQGERMLASGLQANKALDAAEAKLKAEQPKPAKAPRKSRRASDEDEEEEEEEEDAELTGESGEEDEESDEGRSVVKRQYKQRYRPHKNKNGDEIGRLVSDHITRTNDETGEEYRDMAALKKFAVANGCWQPGYKDLNPGMQRMNVVNRLRARMRKEKDFEVIWA